MAFTDSISAPEAAERIATLDIVRGVAVLGILAMNIVNFAMPQAAYINPAAYGHEGAADLVSWLVSFVLFDGKMRGLFTLLFGASLLLVIERAEAKGESGDRVHFRRMGWLAAIGLAHYYFIWEGDILFGYAAGGMAAWFFRDAEPGRLVRVGLALILVQFLFYAIPAASFLHAASAAAQGDADAQSFLAGLENGFGTPSPAAIAKELGTYRGSYGGILAHRFGEDAFWPFEGLYTVGWETVGFMLLGMAGLKSGFLTGAWDDAGYRRAARIGLGIGIPGYLALALVMWARGFEAVTVFALWFAGTELVRVPAVVGIAALIILLGRGGGPWTERFAAAGRVAFTNYLGTSLIMTAFFYGYGLGLFGTLSRAQLWVVVLPMWALMLAWSLPWLQRFHYGPLEWAWRSLARGSLQPMRRRC
jgi:uncharacterized protein